MGKHKGELRRPEGEATKREKQNNHVIEENNEKNSGKTSSLTNFMAKNSVSSKEKEKTAGNEASSMNGLITQNGATFSNFKKKSATKSRSRKKVSK